MKYLSHSFNYFGTTKTAVIKTFLFGQSDFKDSLNKEIIYTTNGFIQLTEGFNCPLFSSLPFSLCDALISYFYLVFVTYRSNILFTGVIAGLAWI